jgi:hypothetical protein
MIDVFLDALLNSHKADVEAKAIDHLFSYLEKILNELNAENQESLLPALQACFQRLSSLPEEKFFLLASSHTPLKRVGQVLLRKVSDGSGTSEFNRLMAQSLRAAYEYWLKEEDPEAWFSGEEGGPSGPGEKPNVLGEISTGASEAPGPSGSDLLPTGRRNAAESSGIARLPGDCPGLPGGPATPGRPHRG